MNRAELRLLRRLLAKLLSVTTWHHETSRETQEAIRHLIGSVDIWIEHAPD